jgi:hypothetical protein
MTAGGILLLYETTRHPKWFDITTGLIEGWQLFSDGYRTSIPLIDAGQWQQVLQKNGFDDIHVFPENSAYDDIFFQHAIIARSRPDGRQFPATVPSMPELDALSTVDENVPADNEALPESMLVQRLKDMTADEQVEQCRHFVSRQLGAVLQKEAEAVFNIRHNLIDLGLDSLMALEFRNCLARGLAMIPSDIPASLIFDYPNIAAIADYLLEIINAANTPATFPVPEAALPPAEAQVSGDDPPFDDTAEVEDIKRLLAEKLDLFDETDQAKTTE